MKAIKILHLGLEGHSFSREGCVLIEAINLLRDGSPAVQILNSFHCQDSDTTTRVMREWTLFFELMDPKTYSISEPERTPYGLLYTVTKAN